MSAPRRARLAVLAAAVTVVATGGAFVALRPDAGSGARPRHRAGGAVAAPTGGLTPAGSVASGAAPASDGGTASASAGASSGSASAGAASTSPPGPGATDGATAGPNGRPGPATTAGHAPAAGPAPTGTTAPAPAKATAPVAPGWRPLPPAPIGGRVDHDAVWTGREMVIWGGEPDLDSEPLTDGAAYDPAAGTWRPVPAAPLAPRYDATAVWTGQEMIIFGGTSTDGDILADGAAWDPATNRWRALPASPLGPRDGAVVAWAGDRMVVWGGATVPPPDDPGATSEMQADGAAYLPATNGWVPVAAAPMPARSGAQAVWTGSRLLVTGGYHEGDDDDRTDGAALDPVSGAWSPIAARPAPGSCADAVSCTGVWTGTVALFPSSGLAYDPAGSSSTGAGHWSAISPYLSADATLVTDPAVWTGTRLLAWGSPQDPSGDAGSGATAQDDSGTSDSGADDSGDAPLPPPVGGLYDPATGRWQPLAGGPLS